jgi:cupin superfamily acireductone dioxygenase involved in methionine salvage
LNKRQSRNIIFFIKDDQEILFVCVGTDERTAGPEDIKVTQEALNQVALDQSLTYVTHHAISFKIIKKKLFDNIEVVGVCQTNDYMKKQLKNYLQELN